MKPPSHAAVQPVISVWPPASPTARAASVTNGWSMVVWNPGIDIVTSTSTVMPSLSMPASVIASRNQDATA